MACNGCCRCSSRSTITWSSTVSGRRSGMPMRPAGWCSSPGTARSAIAGTSGSSTRPMWWSSSSPRAARMRCPRSTWGWSRKASWLWTATRPTRRWPRSRTVRSSWRSAGHTYVGISSPWPDQEAWALGWVDRIGVLYECNDRRLEVPCTTPLFTARDQEVRRCVTSMEQQREDELTQLGLHPARRRVLESLRDHWTGLTVSGEHPEGPMDNNTAERSERGPVVGRKNYYGSGAVWSGRLAAMLFSLFQTLALWGINPRVWLRAYLTACAVSGGRAPAKPEALLPWNLTEDQRRAWSLEPRSNDSS